MVIGVFIFYNLIYACFAYPLGIIADRLGMKKMFAFGLAVFTLVYLGMAFATEAWMIIALFFLYGLYSAATEGISKAWISSISDKKDTATAIGTYASFQSICTMLASSIAGLVWFQFGANITFLLSAFVSLFLVFYFLRLK